MSKLRKQVSILGFMAVQANQFSFNFFIKKSIILTIGEEFHVVYEYPLWVIQNIHSTHLYKHLLVHSYSNRSLLENQLDSYFSRIYNPWSHYNGNLDHNLLLLHYIESYLYNNFHVHFLHCMVHQCNNQNVQENWIRVCNYLCVKIIFKNS